MFMMVLNMLLEALGNDGYCVLCRFKCMDKLQVFKFLRYSQVSFNIVKY